jgi:16S rRNA processing protein RimM
LAEPKRIRVAKIGAAHGIRGEVMLLVDADDPLALKKLGTLEDETGKRTFIIVALREANGRVIARFEGVANRNAAEQLTNLELFVSRDRLPKQKDANTFYQADLVGLRVESTEGVLLGTVTAIRNYGAGDLLEIAPLRGGDTFMIPFVEQFVPTVDIKGERVVVDPPAGTIG